MAKRVNIHQLRGACASLEVRFPWESGDEVEDYSDAHSKLELARQLEDELDDPEGEWMTLSTKISMQKRSSAWIRMIADSAYEAGRIAGEESADNADYLNWTAILTPQHLLRTAYDTLANTHRQCAATEKTHAESLQECKAAHEQCSSIISTLQDEVAQLGATAKEHNACNGRIELLSEQLRRSDIIVKRHSACSGEMDVLTNNARDVEKKHKQCVEDIASLTLKLGKADMIAKMHDACRESIDTLNYKVRDLELIAEEHKKCAGKTKSLTEDLEQASKVAEKHKDCESKLKASEQRSVDHQDYMQAISDLKAQIQQLESPNKTAQQISQGNDRPDVNNDKARVKVLEQQLAKIEADFKDICVLIAIIYESHVHRHSSSITESYRELARRLRTWTCADMKPHSLKGDRKATFMDFVREVVVGLDILTKKYHNTIDEIDKATVAVGELKDDIEALTTERDSWRVDCMELLEKAQLAQKSHDAKERALAQQLTDQDLLIAEMQLLLAEAGLDLAE
ncbi:hypothetical protein HBI52_118230 [Parastagonospora nodorum]|nr:hypothetical protein HBI06_039040 [Parastagonospora nodorum]KAH4239064.1 hypothetical protein HBI05_122020 [Parastagonospora nodorum]KAH5279070.1 hypothetical protein HBI71_018700 [Parastagonospora nodorum]KAH5336372.1 hypothetical protein HBI12_026800 [Parastagonospora nodorum]KAH5514008.1 hypothetical protein HBI52_118230 [Parastagonospora nodorum]